ncbi:phage scaffolding protein [uncultured Oscillibacter sp.]|uniref:phage scaffolding protein n=1 Tax=uncultured Oscillibacter sp. TaxID=876091 RepID=UPI0025DAA40E|nr:phage scaffolding protein [uncultured Oscillibacter sp.]
MDFKSIFNGESLTLEQFNEKTKGMKLADLSGGEYVAKGKAKDLSDEMERLKNDLSQRDETIKRLEEASGDAEATRKELERYKQEEADRKKAEKEAETDRILTEAAEQALDGKEFVNEFTRNHFVAELKKAIADPANKGKRAAKLFEEMTKELDNIFRNPQLEPLKLPGVDKHAGPPMSKEDIFKITDAVERQKAIAANINLFRKDE